MATSSIWHHLSGMGEGDVQSGRAARREDVMEEDDLLPNLEKGKSIMSGNRMTKGMKGTLMSTVLILALAGCYEHTFTVGAGAPHGPVVYDHWENYWLAGLVGHHKYDVEEICPSGNATIEVYESFLNGLVSGLTGGIYTPTTLKIRCQTGRRADLELSSADVERIVLDERFLEAVEATMPGRLEEVREAQALQQDR